MELAIHRAARSISAATTPKGDESKRKLRAAQKKHKKKHKKRASQQQTSTQNDADDTLLNLVAMNAIVEDLSAETHGPNGNAQPQLPASVWDEWLWWSDPNDPPNSQTLLNRCQLLGLLICRYRAARQPPYQGMISLPSGRLSIIGKPAHKMTLRELRDSMSNLVLLWGKDVHGTMGKGDINMDGNRYKSMLLFLDACFHRLGELAWATWPCGDPSSPISDDVASIERVPVASGNSALGNPTTSDREQVTLPCLRSLINTFLVLYRLLHWMQIAIAGWGDAEGEEGEDEVPVEDLPEFTKVHQHHVSASVDSFYLLSMFYDLPPASRLNYRHMFSGLYNCISQPVYYHNPDYQRRMQPEIKDVSIAKFDISTMPALMQIHPEISVLYDDDNLLTSLPKSVSDLAPTERVYAWRWLLSSGMIYLLRWDPKDKTHVVFRERDGNLINCLRRHYIPHRAEHFRSDMTTATQGGTQNLLLSFSRR